MTREGRLLIDGVSIIVQLAAKRIGRRAVGESNIAAVLSEIDLQSACAGHSNVVQLSEVRALPSAIMLGAPAGTPCACCSFQSQHDDRSPPRFSRTRRAGWWYRSW